MLILTAILLLITIDLIISLRRMDISGVKLMFFGFHLTVFGGIIAIDQNSSLGNIEYLISIVGLVISSIGLRKNGN